MRWGCMRPDLEPRRAQKTQNSDRRFRAKAQRTQSPAKGLCTTWNLPFLPQLPRIIVASLAA